MKTHEHLLMIGDECSLIRKLNTHASLNTTNWKFRVVGKRADQLIGSATPLYAVEASDPNGVLQGVFDVRECQLMPLNRTRKAEYLRDRATLFRNLANEFDRLSAKATEFSSDEEEVADKLIKSIKEAVNPEDKRKAAMDIIKAHFEVRYG